MSIDHNSKNITLSCWYLQKDFKVRKAIDRGEGD